MRLGSLEKIFKKKPLLMLLLAIAVFGLIFAGVRPPGLTIISVSKVEIDPQGYADPATSEWKGSFWIVTMLTDMTEQVAAIKLGNDDGEPGSTYVEGSDGTKKYSTDTVQTGEQVVPQSTVVVKIDPGQPYYERPLEIQQGEYVSDAWGGWMNTLGQAGKTSNHVSNLDFLHYEWGTGDWTLHTPFKVTLLKNDVEVATETIDTVGGTKIYRIPETGDEYIHITDLGKLGTGYGEPQLGEILYFSSDYVFQADTTSRKLITHDAGESPHSDADQPNGWSVYGVDAYSVYWYGYGRWKDDDTSGPYEHGDGLDALVDDGEYGGWELNQIDAWTWEGRPEKPVVFPGNKPTLMTHDCLTEWLDHKGVKRATMPSWLDKMVITYDKKMRLYMPFGSVSSVITIKISTELADTIVWQPLVANFEITDFPDLGDIADRKTSTIKVKCLEGSGSGTIWLTKSPEDLPISINPPTIGMGNMAPGTEKTFEYEILNLGCEQDTEFSITASVTNALGTETDTATVEGTLLEKTGAETVLTVKTVYQGDGSAVTGIVITVQYAENSKSGLTNTQGQGTITFSLGSYEGSVKVTSASTATYKPKEVTVNVVSGQQTTVVLELYKYEDPELDWMQYLPWLLLAVAVTVVALVLVKKRKGGKGI